MTNYLPRILIGAPHGRTGKTTLTLGICAALAARGLAVQPFKKGPDYIDPSWLSEAAGRACRTLDPFFHGDEAGLRRAFRDGAAGAALSIIEGNHGLYDSLDDDGAGSSAALARTLRAPVLLVVDCSRMSRSVAALVRGFQEFEPETDIAAVVLNNVAQSRHEGKLRRAIEGYCGIPVLGALPRDEAFTIPDRHLGLVPRGERDELLPALAACRNAVSLHVDLDALLALARNVPFFLDDAAEPRTQAPHPCERRVRLGIVRDEAFSFYYPENLQALVREGAELVSVSALHDAGLPSLDGLYIGGGFPEVFMAELEANAPFRRSVAANISHGLPVYAECGGLMYLSQRIHWDGRSAEMAGILPFEVEMAGRPQGHGYVMAKVEGDNPFVAAGSTLRGHEFHQSRLINWSEDLRALTGWSGAPGWAMAPTAWCAAASWHLIPIFTRPVPRPGRPES